MDPQADINDTNVEHDESIAQGRSAGYQPENMASALVTTRLRNGREAILSAGGVSKVARAMGYSNPSFLVQVFGPNPTRLPTERMVRRIEQALKLPVRSLDIANDSARIHPSSSPSGAMHRGGDMSVDVDRLTAAVSIVWPLIVEYKLSLSHDKISRLLALAYDDESAAVSARLRQVIEMLR